MAYYIAKTWHRPFDQTVNAVISALAAEGFGVLTDIDVAATLKKKLDVDYRPYRILGACNPPFAYKALQAENKIGTMLPCNVIVQQMADHTIQVAAIDPVDAMQTVGNAALAPIAAEIRAKLERVVNAEDTAPADAVTGQRP